MEHDAPAAPVLPVSIIGLVEVGRLMRELEGLENAMQATEIRTGQNLPRAGRLPQLSIQLQQLAEANSITLSEERDRHSLLLFLKEIKTHAPRVHMSFSADPSPDFMAKLMSWLRQHIHPHVLVAVGLQPGIGAGCMLRTRNRFFDMSLSRSFSGKREAFMARLRGTDAPKTPAVTATAEPIAVPPQEVAA
ncbi:MAG: hypothetical protein WBP03_04620 [Candidatus Saccharimonadales bacterium]